MKNPRDVVRFWAKDNGDWWPSDAMVDELLTALDRFTPEGTIVDLSKLSEAARAEVLASLYL